MDVDLRWRRLRQHARGIRNLASISITIATISITSTNGALAKRASLSRGWHDVPRGRRSGRCSQRTSARHVVRHGRVVLDG